MTTLRTATLRDADAIAALHADSWRRHYRGAYADAFLDGPVQDDRRAVWRSRLSGTDSDSGANGGSGTATVVAEDGGGLLGFVHVVLDDDERWGSLVDNLHVTNDRRHTGIGTRLHDAAVRAVLHRATQPRLYLWVLEQNTGAQRFYRSRGGVTVQTVPVGGDPQRLNGTPKKLRVAWETLQPLR